MRFFYEISGRQIGGLLVIKNQVFDLHNFSGVYMRLMDDQMMPEIKLLAADSPARIECRRLHDALFQWLEITDARR